MLFKVHTVHFHLEEYNTIWTCSYCSPVKCGKRDIVSFTSEVQIYMYIMINFTWLHVSTCRHVKSIII
jgi:hypothetical protein